MDCDAWFTQSNSSNQNNKISCFAHKIRNVYCLPRFCTLICIKFMALGTGFKNVTHNLVTMSFFGKLIFKF